jgi:hypothetical protein
VGQSAPVRTGLRLSARDALRAGNGVPRRARGGVRGGTVRRVAEAASKGARGQGRVQAGSAGHGTSLARRGPAGFAAARVCGTPDWGEWCPDKWAA